MNDLNRIIAFIENWAGKSAASLNSTKVSDNIPQSIIKLDQKLGRFWSEPPYPYGPANLDNNTERGLFKTQDMIENPRMEKSDPDGFTRLVSENQGVWHFFYNKDHKLYFEGDWLWGSIDNSYSPKPFPAEIEDVLCFTLLVNFFFYMDNGTWEDVSSRPDNIWPVEITDKLWHHTSWSHFKGFWTNSDGTALLFDGMGLIRKQ